ncbi:MAG: hypothetical protein R3A44_40905 [Caldilineaceae bacterium]
MLTAAEVAHIRHNYPMLAQLPAELMAQVQSEAIAMKAPWDTSSLILTIRATRL